MTGYPTPEQRARMTAAPGTPPTGPAGASSANTEPRCAHCGEPLTTGAVIREWTGLTGGPGRSWHGDRDACKAAAFGTDDELDPVIPTDADVLRDARRDALLVLLSRAGRGVLSVDEGELLRHHVEAEIREGDQARELAAHDRSPDGQPSTVVVHLNNRNAVYEPWPASDALSDTSPTTDGGLREQYAAAVGGVRVWRTINGCDGWEYAGTEALAESVLAVRDRRMEQLAAGRDTWKAKAAEIEQDRDRIKMRAERTARTLGRVRGLSDRTVSGQWIDPAALRFIFDTQDPEPATADDQLALTERAEQAEAEMKRLGLMVDEYGEGARQLSERLGEARQWARHGYEIGQRHCGWSDHGVAPAWLTEGWPAHFDSCEHLRRAADVEEVLAVANQVMDMQREFIGSLRRIVMTAMSCREEGARIEHCDRCGRDHIGELDKAIQDADKAYAEAFPANADGPSRPGRLPDEVPPPMDPVHILGVWNGSPAEADTSKER